MCFMPLSKLLSNDFTVDRRRKICYRAAVKDFSMDEEGEGFFKAGTHHSKNTRAI